METKTRTRALIISACLLLTQFESFSQERVVGVQKSAKKPLALVGASYGRYEKRIVTNNIIIHSKDETYLFKDCGLDIPWDDLNKYSLLIVATSVKTPATSEQIGKLREFVENGGHLMLIHSVVRSICGGWSNLQKGKWFQWAGIKTVTYVRKGMDAKILDPANPLMKGVLKKQPADGEFPPWPTKVSGVYVVTPAMKVIVGNGEKALVATAKVGKGMVTVFGEELFRKRGKKPKADAEMYLKIMLNTVRAASPASQSTLTKELSEKKEGASDAAPVLFWNREWTRGERYGPRFTPPLPNDDELVSELETDMAVGEYDSLQLNLTPMKDLKRVSWKLDTGDFPAEKAEFLVQARPDPIKWKNPAIAKEFPYWMMPPEYVSPKGSKDFTLFPKHQTRVVWLRLNSHEVDPGNYNLKLRLTFDGNFTKTIPVLVKIHKVILPRHRMITLAAAGQVYGDANRPAPALRFANDLQAHGVEWSLVNAYRPWLFGIVGTKSKLKAAYLRKNKDKLAKGPLPLIDFSCLDPWMEQAIGHGLTKFKIGTPNRYFGTPLKRAGIVDPALKKRLNDWFLSEISRYMREKGVDTLVCSRGDELSLEELKKSWKPWAARLHEAGWDCSSTFSFKLNDATYPFINEISEYVKLWTYNRSIVQYFISLKKKGLIKLRPDAIIGTYGAGEGRGSEHRKPLGRSRVLGWESWYEGVQNCQVNPYFKGWLYYCDYRDRGEAGGIGGERFVSFINVKDLSVPVADCPFWDGVRDGMEEGNLAAILSWYIRELKKLGGDSARLAVKAEEDLAKIIGPSPDAVLKVETRRQHNGHDVRVVVGDTPKFKKAKRLVLELLDSIRPTANSSIKPSLYWNQTPLIVSGRPAAALCGPAKQIEELQKAVFKLSGMKLPEMPPSSTAPPTGVETVISIGNASANPFSAATLKLNNARDADNGYPGAGSYYIKKLKNNGRMVLLVAGPGNAGTSKGVAMFAKFLHSTGHWL